MMLRRCLWWEILDGRQHQLWGNYNGTWSSPYCTPIMNGIFGEPSFRKLASGTWAAQLFEWHHGLPRDAHGTVTGRILVSRECSGWYRLLRRLHSPPVRCGPQ
jgi:hypothetical protein